MRMQDSAANCGPTALSNALASVGVVRSAAECEQLCKTSATHGTSAKKINDAAVKLGLSPCVIKEKKPDVAVLRLESAMRRGRPVLLIVDGDSHWVAAVGIIGQRTLVADSADNELVLSYAPDEMLSRWAGAKGGYFGIEL